MTQEEKARRYDEALERARKCLDEKRDTCFVRPDVIFPELAESKDERIRKELLESFKYQQRESRTDKEWLNGIKLSEVVDWLEKQVPKQEWSEEDSKVIDNCCLLIAAEDDSYEKAFKDDCIHYLQNLKQRMGV